MTLLLVQAVAQHAVPGQITLQKETWGSRMEVNWRPLQLVNVERECRITFSIHRVFFFFFFPFHCLEHSHTIVPNGKKKKKKEDGI